MNGSSGSNNDRFDSWRTQQRYQANADYFYDQKLPSKPHYSQKQFNYPAPPPPNDQYFDNYHPHYHPNHNLMHQNAANMGMYTYNSRRYQRDYDPDF